MKSKLLEFIAALVLSACAQLEKPQTFSEQVAYAEAGSQAAIKTVADLTCFKYLPTGVCAEPGKPIHPAKAKLYVEQLSQARAAARAASTMPTTGGNCLGSPSTPTACLQLASSLLAEIQKILLDIQKGG